MKATVTTTIKERRLVAVLGNLIDEKRGIFTPSGYYPDRCIYLDPNGLSSGRGFSLEYIAKDKGRIPVYEGDTVTIEF